MLVAEKHVRIVGLFDSHQVQLSQVVHLVLDDPAHPDNNKEHHNLQLNVSVT